MKGLCCRGEPCVRPVARNKADWREKQEGEHKIRPYGDSNRQYAQRVFALSILDWTCGVTGQGSGIEPEDLTIESG